MCLFLCTFAEMENLTKALCCTLTLICLLNLHGSDGANILLLTPPLIVGSKSHLHLMTKLGRILVSRGHKATIILYGDMKVKDEALDIERVPSYFNQTGLDEFEAELDKSERRRQFRQEFDNA